MSAALIVLGFGGAALAILLFFEGMARVIDGRKWLFYRRRHRR